MTRVFVGIGSNTDPVSNLATGIALLRQRFGGVRLSPVYRNQAVGFEGQDFFNLVAEFNSDRSPHELAKDLREIEDHCGRDRELPKYGPRTLDLDLLLYGDLQTARMNNDTGGLELPRAEILQRSYILKPMADLSPDLRHPVIGRRYVTLWQEFDNTSHPLVEVDMKL